MGTRSFIGIRRPGGKVEGIYCHWDGYPEGVGLDLWMHYQDREQVEKLIGLGSLSSLGEKVDPNPNHPHSFDIPQKHVTVAYHRDRGEEWEQNKPRIYDSTEDVFQSCGNNWQEYGYIYEEDGHWTVFSVFEDDDIGESLTLRNLTDVLRDKGVI